MAKAYKIFDHSDLKTTTGSPVKRVKGLSSIRQHIADDLVRSIDSTIKYLVTGEGTSFSDPSYGTTLKYLVVQHNVTSEELLVKRIVERVIPKVNTWLNNQTNNLIRRVDLVSARLVAKGAQPVLEGYIALYTADNTQVLYDLSSI